MTELLPPHRWKSRVPQDLRYWLRQGILLCSIATSVVLIGDRTLVDALSRTAVQAPSLTPAAQPNLALFTNLAVGVHQSIGGMSKVSFEVVSLVVLGLCLLGGGRALSRERQTRRPLRDAVSQAAGPAAVLNMTRRLEAPNRVGVRQNAAR